MVLSNGCSVVCSNIISLVSGIIQRIVTCPMDLYWNCPTDFRWHVPMMFICYEIWCVVFCPEQWNLAVHPVRNPRFASFRTQPLENLRAAVKLPIKQRFLGNPTLGTNLGQRILAMRTVCSSHGPVAVCSSSLFSRRPWQIPNSLGSTAWSDATCLMRPRLFYVCAFVVSRIAILSYLFATFEENLR